MLKFVRLLVVGMLFGVVPAIQMLAQNHPMPGSKSEPAVICNGCPGTNAVGQPNDGLKTYPYSSPIVDHAGRYVDSSNVPQFMNIGIRTVRAQAIHVAKNTRGTAPPRIYIQLGSAIGAYTLDSFFATKLPSSISPGMTSIDQVFGAVRQSPPGRNPPEKFVKWDQFVYPEATTNWRCPFQDGQDRLGDFDFDDRGYIYAAYTVFGWGIVKDEGKTDGSHMTKVVQLIGGGDTGDPTKYPKTLDDTTGVSPETMMVFKSGSKYYAVITSKVRTTAIWDVTDPAAPKLVTLRPGEQYAMRKWDRDDASQRFAYVDYNNKLHVYDYADYIAGGAALLEQTAASGKFVDVSFDENGNLWAVESKSNLWKFTKSGSHYSQQMYTPFPTLDDIKAMHMADGYVMVAGTERGATIYFDVRLLKVESNNVRVIDTDDYFRKYYHEPPKDYAKPGSYAAVQSDVQVLKWNGKTYIFYSVFGLGDVYEVQGGESINIKVKNDTFGTANPNSKSTTAGPYVGDIVTFSAPSSNSQITYDVTWDFGNPEGGATENNGQNKSTGEISHQYTGYVNANQITQTKNVRAVTVQDSAVASSYALTLKVPAPRVGISGVATALSASTNFDVVAGQTFNDASDGSIPGHYAAWTIDSTLTKQAPNQSIAAGGVGAHTMSFKGYYGRHDDSFNGTSLYETPALNFNYTVLPFKVALNNPTADATNVTFGGTGNVTPDTSIVTARTWTITWTFTPGGTATSAPITSTQTANIGVIPAFQVPKTSVTTGSVITLQAVVDAAGLADPAKPYGTSTASMTLSTPDPAVTITGCANAGSPCKFTASSLSSASMSDWVFSWTLKKDGIAYKVGTGNPFEPVVNDEGNYTISLKVTKSIFDATAEKSLTVAGSLCAALPASTSIGINKIGCSSGCAAGTTVTFSASIQGYVQQSCHTFAWSFGSGEGTGTGIEASHTYNSAGTFTVTLTITRTSDNSQVVKSTQVQINGSQTDNSCTAPTNATITYAGTNGCTTGTNCRTTEAIVFTAKRGVNSLQTCDNVSWTFSDNTSSTSRQPSKQWGTPGTYTATVTISNTKGSATSQPMSVTIVNPPSGNCSTAPGPGNFAILFVGPTSGCSNFSGLDCQLSESVGFSAQNYSYTPAACDSYEWDFGDGSPKVTTVTANHAFAAPGTFPVKLKISNQTGSWTYSKSVKIQGTVATKPVPVIAATTFPANGVKNRTVTFAATSNIATTTGWTWTFGDGSATDTSQAGETKQASTITHTFTKTGSFTVKATARNSEDAATAPVGAAQGSITIADAPAIPEFRYLLPVAVHAKGQFNSVWRTDVQIYNSDPNVSVTTPLRMTASFKGSEFNLEVTKSTTIYEDFLGRLLDHDDQGPVIITTKNTMTPPQIWTRTYNQAENGGTFGQFIPAIRIDNAGSGGAVDSGTYFLSGLRHDDRYRTNIGFLNPNAAAVIATVTVYDERRLKLGEYTETLQPFQLVQYALKSKETETFKLPATAPFSVKITIPSTGGNWLIAYASFIDGVSNDPVFLQAIRESDVSSADYKVQMVPGVGHTGAWRSDVTIFNPDPDAVQFDLLYYNADGVKKGEALGIVLDSGKFLQYGDLLRQGVLGNVDDGFGVMKLNVTGATHEMYPMTFARTYFDDTANGTYGQGISAFATARANVKLNKPALIAGVRNTSSYKTNIGLVNVSNAAVTAKITLLDPITGAGVNSIDYPLAPNQSIIGSYNGFGSIEQGTLKIEANGDVWAFCSVIDNRTKDPEYVPATPMQ